MISGSIVNLFAEKLIKLRRASAEENVGNLLQISISPNVKCKSSFFFLHSKNEFVIKMSLF